MRHAILSAALAATLGLNAQQTQLKPFQPSPAASVTQDVGSFTVKIDYSRPAVKGRKIWGGLVPFGEVWRTGANNATVITFSDPVKIGGKDLAAGSYAFFAIPGPKAWTLIFNKNAKQWGSYEYKKELDALTVEAVPTTLPATEEYLQYAIHMTSPEALRVDLNWEKLSVGFDVAVDTPGLYWAYLTKTLAGAKPEEAGPFTQGANYCLASGTHLDQGLAWIDQAIKVKETYRNQEIKARLLWKTGKKAEALPFLLKAIEMAKAAKIAQENLDALEKTKAEWTAK